MTYKPRGVDRRRSTASRDPLLTTVPERRAEGDRRSGEDRRRLGRVAGQAIFRDVPFSAVERIVSYCQSRELETGDLLLTPGAYNHFLYLLIDGRLNVHLDKLDGEKAFTIGAGEYVGEISIIDGRPATAFVVAAQPCRLLGVPEAQFWTEFIAVPGIARNFMRLYADRFRVRNQMMKHAVEERLRYEHLEKELGIAHEIQASMLPHRLDLKPDIEVVAKMAPARQVGGDFYDVFACADGGLCIAIGDVSGKGVPAALFMVRAMTLLRTEMLKPQSLEDAVQQLNVSLYKGNEQCMFVTLTVVVVNPVTGHCRYVVAGHDPMIHGGRGGLYRFLPSPGGMLAGVNRQAEYESATLSLTKGDILILYTDGVTEAMNRRHELFTKDRLLGCLAGEVGLTAAEVSKRIEGAVAAFVEGAPPSDDLTMVILRYQGG